MSTAPSDLIYATIPPRSEAQTALAVWFRRLELRSFLTEADRRTVMAFAGKLDEHRPSRDVVRLAERTRHASLVVSGVVARFGQVHDGSRQLTAFFIPGDMADLHSAVMPVASQPLQSTSAVVVYRVEHEEIRAAGEDSPTLARAFWRDCVADSQVAAEWMVNIGRRSALARVAHLLCELGCRYRSVGLADRTFPLGPTQAQLGDALGLTGVHVNRMMRTLRDRGLIRTSEGRVVVLDWDGLVAAGEFDAGYLHLTQENPD